MLSCKWVRQRDPLIRVYHNTIIDYPKSILTNTFRGTMNPKDSYIIHPVGRIRTPHTAQTGAPIQPSCAKDAEGVVEIFPEFREALTDLEGFERIWLIFWCDRAKSHRLKVVPHRDVVERGLFATRAPSRPNPIGISAVRLNEVNLSQGTLLVRDVDLLDKTPILDIKPYIPSFDSHPVSKGGWLDAAGHRRKTADGRFSGNV